MEHLSENTIKKAALRFFKTYYKFRPRLGKTISSFDLETKNGIIVDGSLSFQQEDQSDFLAAFEATSLETKEEVIFTVQSKLLLWDSLAISLLCTSFGASYGFYYNHFTVHQIGWIASISVLVGIFGLTFFAYQYLFQWLKRYRYIYAVEQFKRYHADEQWIALAEDVFDKPTDPYLKELKDQCIINGFGLIVIDNELETHVFITPSRQEVFGKKRSSMSSLNRDAAIQRSKLERAKLWLNNALSNLTNQRSENSLLRYQRFYWNQILLSAIAIFIISMIFYKEANDGKIAYVDEKKYEKNLLEVAKKTEPETKDFIIDTPFVESAKTKVKPYILINSEESDSQEEFTEKGINLEESNNEFPNIGILITTLEGELVAYDCERIFNYIGTKFIIQQGVFPSFSKARKKIETLNSRGVNANCLWTGCFTQDQSEYIVFIDLLFDDRKEAALISNSLKRKFKFQKGELQIRAITLQKP